MFKLIWDADGPSTTDEKVESYVQREIDLYKNKYSPKLYEIKIGQDLVLCVFQLAVRNGILGDDELILRVDGYDYPITKNTSMADLPPRCSDTLTNVLNRLAGW
jgi:hypothetical protein